jgi:hypothetical protein
MLLFWCNLYHQKKPLVLTFCSLTQSLRWAPTIWKDSGFVIFQETSLLRRLQAQTLPDEAPPIGKIHPFSKMAITFEQLMGF